MQLATCLIALGGDRRNSVPKTVTAPEAAVLQAIHGQGSVFDVEVIDEVDRSERDEIARLRDRYRTKDIEGNRVIDMVYPGRTPALHVDFEDLQLPDEQYKATARAKPAPKKDKAKASSKKKAPPPPANEEPENSADNLFDDEPGGDE